MAHSLFIIFFRVFSYFLISFIFLWSFCKISIILLKEGAMFRFTRTIFRLKIVYGNLNRSKIVFFRIGKVELLLFYINIYIWSIHVHLVESADMEACSRGILSLSFKVSSSAMVAGVVLLQNI